MEKENIYQYKVQDITGKTFDFENLKGKKILIVNTASKCGLTPQFSDLEEIHKQYGDESFTVVGFPSNDFAGQEPGSSEEIASFCERNYGVSFPMMEKVTVLGDGMCALYQFLTKKDKNGLADSTVEWNFQKFLIDRNGYLEKVVSPKIAPTDPEIVDWIKE